MLREKEIEDERNKAGGGEANDDSFSVFKLGQQFYASDLTNKSSPLRHVNVTVTASLSALCRLNCYLNASITVECNFFL